MSIKDDCLALCEKYNLDPYQVTTVNGKNMPCWCQFIQRVQEVQRKAAPTQYVLPPQPITFANAPLTVFGIHESSTIDQMKTCLTVGQTVGGVVCADGHLGYAQPVGGVIAYEDQVSISGVGFDIACGNMAIRLDVTHEELGPRVHTLARDIAACISFGVGRNNDEKVEHALLDDKQAWLAAGMEDYRSNAASQLGTVGSGNHYVDLLVDENGFTWVGVHFGSRGLGHTTATRYLKAAGGKDGINVAPTVVNTSDQIGRDYLAGMELAGRYAYAGREWVCERVRRLIGGNVTDTVHNHHNFAWRETHDGRELYVVRKGATPCFPGQRGFIGGSMGDDCVIIKGRESDQAHDSLYSTIHGAGRTFGRKEAKRRYTREQMEQWLVRRQVVLVGGDVDESPMAYRRLPEVLSYHSESHEVEHTLRPFAVVMAGDTTHDPFKD